MASMGTALRGALGSPQGSGWELAAGKWPLCSCTSPLGDAGVIPALTGVAGALVPGHTLRGGTPEPGMVPGELQLQRGARAELPCQGPLLRFFHWRACSPHL